MSKIIKITAFFLFFVMCFCVKNAFAAVASCSGVNNDGQTHYGTINGVCYAYYCNNGSVQKLGSTSSSSCNSSACSTGATQNKYTASGCSYSTTTRECCSDGNWSNWGEDCPDPSASCSSTQCWNGSSCANKPSGTGYNGKCYFTYFGCTCVKGSGWSCNKNFQNKEQKGSSIVQGWYSSGGPSGQVSCQPSTKSAYGSGSGTTDANSLCVTEARARGISGLGTLDGSCYIIYNYNYSQWILNLTCYTNEKVCE